MVLEIQHFIVICGITSKKYWVFAYEIVQLRQFFQFLQKIPGYFLFNLVM